MKKMDMNLLDSYKRVSKIKANKDATNRVYVLIIIGAVLILGGLWGKLMLDNRGLKQEIQVIQDYVNNPVIVAQIERIDAIQSDINKLDTILVQLEIANNAFNYMPRYDSTMINTLYEARPTTVKIESIAFSGDRVVLSVSATRIYSISDYVLRLRRFNTFQEVLYSGYSYQDGLYITEIQCIVKGRN